VPLSNTELGIQRRFLARYAALEAAVTCVGDASSHPYAVSCAAPLGISFEMCSPDTAVFVVPPGSAAAAASRSWIITGHMVLSINRSECLGGSAVLEVRIRPPGFFHALVLGVPQAYHRASGGRPLRGTRYAVRLHQCLEQRADSG